MWSFIFIGDKGVGKPNNFYKYNIVFKNRVGDRKLFSDTDVCCYLSFLHDCASVWAKARIHGRHVRRLIRQEIVIREKEKEKEGGQRKREREKEDKCQTARAPMTVGTSKD